MSGILKPIVKEESKHVVKFESKRKKIPDPNAVLIKNRRVRNEENSEDNEEKQEDRLSLKQAKFDVFKFGIKGFDKKKQEDAKVQLAIKLGAKVRK
jgi:hypothetical protein